MKYKPHNYQAYASGLFWIMTSLCLMLDMGLGKTVISPYRLCGKLPALLYTHSAISFPVPYSVPKSSKFLMHTLPAYLFLYFSLHPYFIEIGTSKQT